MTTCTNLGGISGLTIECGNNQHINQERTEAAARLAADIIKQGGKIVKMIIKQHHLESISQAGDGWFDQKGNFKNKNYTRGEKYGELIQDKHAYKYCIRYSDKDNRQNKFVWCFN